MRLRTAHWQRLLGLKPGVGLVGDCLLGIPLVLMEHLGLHKVVLGEGLGGEIERGGVPEDLYPFRNLMGLEFTEIMLVVCC